MSTNTKPAILTRVAAMGYPVFENGDYDINIIGVRSAERHAGAFDDVIHLAYKINDQWRHYEFAATCDPGVYWLQNGRSEGTAILVPGHYRACWELGMHRGRYKALCQVKGMSIYRDNTRDEIIDMDVNRITNNTVIGLNLHRAHSSHEFEVERVGKYSAGCQVIQSAMDFDMLITACEMQVSERGWRSFSYTLIEE